MKREETCYKASRMAECVRFGVTVQVPPASFYTNVIDVGADG